MENGNFVRTTENVETLETSALEQAIEEKKREQNKNLGDHIISSISRELTGSEFDSEVEDIDTDFQEYDDFDYDYEDSDIDIQDYYELDIEFEELIQRDGYYEIYSKDPVEVYRKQNDRFSQIKCIMDMSLEDKIYLFNSGLFDHENCQAFRAALDKALKAYDHRSIEDVRSDLAYDTVYAAMLGTPELTTFEEAKQSVAGDQRFRFPDLEEYPYFASSKDFNFGFGAWEDVIGGYNFIKKSTEDKTGLTGTALDQAVHEAAVHSFLVGASENAYGGNFKTALLSTQVKSPAALQTLKQHAAKISYQRATELGGELEHAALLEGEELRDVLSSCLIWTPANLIGPSYEVFANAEKRKDAFEARAATINFANRQFLENITEKPLPPDADANKIVRNLNDEYARQLDSIMHVARKGCKFKDIDSVMEFNDELHKYSYEYQHEMIDFFDKSSIEKIAAAAPNPNMDYYAEADEVNHADWGTGRLTVIRGFTEYLQRYNLCDNQPEAIDKALEIESSPEAGWLFKMQPHDAIDFPLGARPSAKYAWCEKNALVQLGPAWGQQSIGKFLYTRLQNGVEKNLHDASMLLSTFEIPSFYYDVEKIQQDFAAGKKSENTNEYTIKLKDPAAESEFLSQLLHLSPEQRNKVRLSNREQKIFQLFSEPANMFIYQEILKYYGENRTEPEEIMLLVDDDFDEFYQGYQSSGKLTPVNGDNDASEQSLRDHIQDVLESMLARGGEPTPRDISLQMQKLSELGQNRTRYVDEATSWLTKHMVTPSNTLTQAWTMRQYALADGVPDKASEISRWSKEKGVLDFFRGHSDEFNYSGPISLSDLEDGGRYSSFVHELARCYEPVTTLDAIAYYKVYLDDPPKKTLPASEKHLEYKGSNEYVGTVLSATDPRGMTIGVDTGCCMTVGGVSDSCIESGYRDANAGFFALYEGSGKIMAQSYFYVNPEHPDTVIMDNIESNAGRGANKIIDLYTDFFRQYLQERFRDDPTWQIRQVNVGTQYGELVKPIVERLESTDIIRNPDDAIYSDARSDQRLLLRLTDEEIAAARRGEIAINPDDAEKLTPTHETSEFAVPLGIDQSDILADLEGEIYSGDMRQYDDPDFLYDELTQPGVEQFSFLINSQTDANKQPVGYCLAYEAPSETDPNFEGKNIYIADFAITEGNRSFAAALSGLDEIIKRANDHDVDKIELSARENTSYRLLTSRLGERLLARRGFRLTDHGVDDTYDNGESTRLLSLDRL